MEGNSKVGLNFLGFSSYQTIIICEQLRRLTDEKIRLCRNSYFSDFSQRIDVTCSPLVLFATGKNTQWPDYTALVWFNYSISFEMESKINIVSISTGLENLKNVTY